LVEAGADGQSRTVSLALQSTRISVAGVRVPQIMAIDSVATALCAPACR
jgi:hypothetical protein